MKLRYAMALLLGVMLGVLILVGLTLFIQPPDPEQWQGAGHVTYRIQNPLPTPPQTIIAEIQPVMVNGQPMKVIILHSITADENRMLVDKVREGRLAVVKP